MLLRNGPRHRKPSSPCSNQLHTSRANFNKQFVCFHLRSAACSAVVPGSEPLAALSCSPQSARRHGYAASTSTSQFVKHMYRINLLLCVSRSFHYCSVSRSASLTAIHRSTAPSLCTLKRCHPERSSMNFKSFFRGSQARVLADWSVGRKVEAKWWLLGWRHNSKL